MNWPTFLCIGFLSCLLSGHAMGGGVDVRIEIIGVDVKMRKLIDSIQIYLVDLDTDELMVGERSPKLTDEGGSLLLESSFRDVPNGRYALRCRQSGTALSYQLRYAVKEFAVQPGSDKMEVVKVKLPMTIVSTQVQLAGVLQGWSPDASRGLFFELCGALSEQGDVMVDHNFPVGKRSPSDAFTFEVNIPLLADGFYFARLRLSHRGDGGIRGVENSSVKKIEIKGGMVVGGKLIFDSKDESDKKSDNPSHLQLKLTLPQ